MSCDVMKMVQNVSERPEYRYALKELQPVLYDLPPVIVTIDGKVGVGKTTLGRFLAWRFNITLIETDLFLIRNTGKFEYRTNHLKPLIVSRTASERPVLVEGAVVLQLLHEMGLKSDFHIHVISKDAEGSTVTEAAWAWYEKSFNPAAKASLILELPIIF